MKATIEVPDELHRRRALEGRAVREVAVELFRGYVREEGREIPRWFGALVKYTRRVEKHDMEAIRESIARGITAEREL